MKKTKIIIITGGVFSSLGKGIIAASIGRIFKEMEYKVSALKLDPYLNLDPGTMSPYQHGEVFVTHDGGETDLDLGHYERFLGYEVSKFSSVSAGKIYDRVLKKERNGEYGGSTVQIVPHITNEIKNSVQELLDQKQECDFLLIEIGGTVGDIESLPFIEALRQFKTQYGKNNLMFLHVSPLIDLKTSNELKTKPTQHSIRTLREHGIVPDLLVLRSPVNVDDKTKKKISVSCDFLESEIFTCTDVNNIYLIPELLYEQKIDQKILEYFNLPSKNNNIDNWINFTKKITQEKKYVAKIALVGKYVALPDAYLSIMESFKLASYDLGVDLKIDLVSSEEIETQTNMESFLSAYDGICIPYGFGPRGVQGKIKVIQFCRENNVPFLGICLGMQLACIEFARNVLGWHDADSTEFNLKTQHPIFIIQSGKKADSELGGTLRLGDYELEVKPKTLAHKLYKSSSICERHRHRYEFNNDYLEIFKKHGMVFSVQSKFGKMQEMIEILDHKYFIACQFHPEFKSKPQNVNPLFSGLIQAVMKEKKDE